MTRDLTLITTALIFLALGALSSFGWGLSHGYERVIGDMQTRTLIK